MDNFDWLRPETKDEFIELFKDANYEDPSIELYIKRARDMGARKGQTIWAMIIAQSVQPANQGNCHKLVLYSKTWEDTREESQRLLYAFLGLDEEDEEDE